MATRCEVFFDSSGERCAAYLYRPTAELAPCVVMAHGFSGTRSLGLLAWAERFQAAGFAALVFDYRYFGSSGGIPRQVINIAHQQEDYRAAIAFARRTTGIDPDRIALWGTSLSGGHVVVVAASDARIAAVVAQVPLADAVHGSSTMQLPAMTRLKNLAAVGYDLVKSWFGRRPFMIRVAGKPGQAAIFTDPEARAAIEAMARETPEWRNEIAIRPLWLFLSYRPIAWAYRLRMPLLVCVAEHDRYASPALAVEMAERAPQGEVRRYPVGHFDLYSGEMREQVIADQIEFLRRHLVRE
jgi:fermentation-respiration switch protein FrsA (DUF1100 family)